MFLRRQGKQVHLLQSYRDSLGRVRQRLVSSFGCRTVMEREWKEVEKNDPSLRGHLYRLKDAAAQMVDEVEPDPVTTTEKLRFHARKLLKLLLCNHQDVPELEALAEKLLNYGVEESSGGHFRCPEPHTAMQSTCGDSTGDLAGVHATGEDCAVVRSSTGEYSAGVRSNGADLFETDSGGHAFGGRDFDKNSSQAALSRSELLAKGEQVSLSVPDSRPSRESLGDGGEHDRKASGAKSNRICSNPSLDSSTSSCQSLVLSLLVQSSRRRGVGRLTLGTQLYVRILESLGSTEALNCDHERLSALGERVRVRPDLCGLTGYALALAQAGLVSDSLETLSRFPGGDGWANLNRAALYWKLGELNLALESLLKGLAKEVDALAALSYLSKGWQPVDGRSYWDAYGHLWDERSRRFLLSLFKQPLIKLRLESVRRGQRMRTLLIRHHQPVLLERVMEATFAEKPSPRAHGKVKP